MTYIIAEPCIDIKDRSCVDVCPVDCIHEFERILVIDPEECIDCFAGSEQFLTTYGLRTFEEMEGEACRVLTDDGFRPALIKKFRRKPLVKLELDRELDPDRDDEPFVSPFSARCLLTVRAAISFARFVERPCFFSLSLMCSY